MRMIGTILICSLASAALALDSTTVNVADFGARGDGLTDDTAAIRMALSATAGGVIIPAGHTFLLTDQITVPENVQVYAYGAALMWTQFGAALASNPTEAAATGNGIRLNSNSGWHGGYLKMLGVPTPSGTAIPAKNYSGAFWNQIAIGHFNPVTTAAMSIPTENVIVEDVGFELVSGSRVSAILIAGYTRNVIVRHCTDTHTSNSTADMSFLEATWGGDARYTWHPHQLLLEDLTLTEYAGPGHTASARGVHISGAYDVAVRNLRVRDSIWPLTFYIGDPGDPGGNPLAVNPLQAGKIATGLLLDGLYADHCNIGLRILGDAAGSTSSERGTHSVPVVARNVRVNGMGAVAPTSGAWLSNVGIYTDSANDVTVIGGELKNLYDGFVNRVPPPEYPYTPNRGFVIEGLKIHDIAGNGLSTPGLIDAQLIGNVVYDVNKAAGAR